jgi:hypothetical protein
LSPKRSGYRELGLELVSLEEKHSRQPKKPLMVDEKRDEAAENPIKFLVTEALAQERNEMLENFSQILKRIPTIKDMSSSSSHFGDATPFKVQVNFDIPVFEGQIDVNALEKWLNLIEDYFIVHNFFQ